LIFASGEKLHVAVVGGAKMKTTYESRVVLQNLATSSSRGVRNAGAQGTRCAIAFADMTGRCAASAMARLRPLAMQA
jgi:hypothetical protein